MSLSDLPTAPSFAARHSMDSPEWYTPAPFVEAARTVMGGIDLDPASHEEANLTVRAARFFTKEDNGLIQPWAGRVFLNPPGGDGLVPQFWRRLIQQIYHGGVTQAIWIGYSLEQLQTLQKADAWAKHTPLDYPICVPSRRIAFVENDAKRAARGGKRAASPSHGNYISYLGPNRDAFAQYFSMFGQVRL